MIGLIDDVSIFSSFGEGSSPTNSKVDLKLEQADSTVMTIPSLGSANLRLLG